MNYITTYYNLIKSGKILVSKKILKQYEKIIYDLNNPGKYHFDIKKAKPNNLELKDFAKV